MGMRRKSREILLQLLFQAEVNPEKDPARLLEALPYFKKTTAASERASELFLKIYEKRDYLDQFIEKHADNWRLSRMSHIDRNILRYAVYELFYCEDIPKEVVLNEAIEIAKSFGTEESSAFVNGVLDRCKQAIAEEMIT